MLIHGHIYTCVSRDEVCTNRNEANMIRGKNDERYVYCNV